MDENEFLGKAAYITKAICQRLHERILKHGFLGEKLAKPGDLKSTHDIDYIAADIALEALRGTGANVFIESIDTGQHDAAQFSIYIDPVDGSLNYDRGIGDPSVAIAMSRKPQIESLEDLEFAYILGLRSQHAYFTKTGESHLWINGMTKTHVIKCTPKQNLAESVAYLRPGYGFSEHYLAQVLPIFLKVKDIRAIDNTAMEMCEIARNAADIMIEARNASDVYNLLAYPILRNAGGLLLDLHGNNLAKESLDLNKDYDYIATNSQPLAIEAIEAMANFRQSTNYTIGRFNLTTLQN